MPRREAPSGVANFDAAVRDRRRRGWSHCTADVATRSVDRHVRLGLDRVDPDVVLGRVPHHPLVHQRDVLRPQPRRELPRDLGDQLPVEAHPRRAFEVRVHAREWGRHSGIVTEMPPYGLVFTIRGGKVVRWCAYPDQDSALEATGLSE